MVIFGSLIFLFSPLLHLRRLERLVQPELEHGGLLFDDGGGGAGHVVQEPGQPAMEIYIFTVLPGWGAEKKEAPEGFEPSISCLLDRRFNQLSHGAAR